MEKEKLDKAAEKEVEDCFCSFFDDEGEYIRVNNAFKIGVNWLMQQPLADRLTDEEKEKIKSLYKWATECTDNNEEAAVTQTVLENIFGKELFNEK